jgi:Tol biopolymer transport system component
MSINKDSEFTSNTDFESRVEDENRELNQNKTENQEGLESGEVEGVFEKVPKNNTNGTNNVLLNKILLDKETAVKKLKNGLFENEARKVGEIEQNKEEGGRIEDFNQNEEGGGEKDREEGEKTKIQQKDIDKPNQEMKEIGEEGEDQQKKFEKMEGVKTNVENGDEEKIEHKIEEIEARNEIESKTEDQEQKIEKISQEIIQDIEAEIIKNLEHKIEKKDQELEGEKKDGSKEFEKGFGEGFEKELEAEFENQDIEQSWAEKQAKSEFEKELEGGVGKELDISQNLQKKEGLEVDNKNDDGFYQIQTKKACEIEQNKVESISDLDGSTLNVVENVRKGGYNQYASEYSNVKPKSTFLSYILSHKGLFALFIFSLIFFGLAISLLNNQGFRQQTLVSKIELQVVDSNKQPIVGAKVKIDDKNYVSDENGKVVGDKIVFGLKEILVEANGFQTAKSQQNLNPFVPLNLRLVLETATSSQVKGKLNTKQTLSESVIQDLNFTIGGIPVKTMLDGSFSVDGLPLGKVKVKINSQFFDVFEKEIELKPGLNEIGSLDLIPTVSLPIKVVDWINQKPLEGVKIKYNQNEVSTSSDGSATLSRVLPKTELELVLEATKYNSKSVKVELKEENNELKIEMVRAGKLFFSSDRDGSQNIYSSNYDGSEEQKITNEEGVLSFRYIESEQNPKIVYLTQKDNIRDSDNVFVAQGYSVDIDGKNNKRITKVKGFVYNQNQEERDQIYLEQQKVLTFTETSTDLNRFPNNNEVPFVSSVFISNLDGSQKKQIFKFEEAVESFRATRIFSYNNIMSDNGKWVVLLQTIENRVQYGSPVDIKLWLINTENGEKVEVYNDPEAIGGYPDIMGVSDDGNKVIFRSYNNINNRGVVEVFDKRTKRRKNLGFLENFYGRLAFTPDYNSVLLLESRDAKTDIWEYNFEDNSSKKITQTGKIDAFDVDYSQNLIYIQDNDVLKVMDISQGFDKVGEAKEVPISTNFKMLRFSRENYGY